MSPTEYYIKLQKRREQMAYDVFAHPPKTWEEFQKRLGQAEELDLSILDIEALIKGTEEDT